MFGKKKEPVQDLYKSATITVIAEGVEMDGELETTEPLIVNGKFSGKIDSSNEVLVNESGFMDAEGSMTHLKIKGKVGGAVRVVGDTELAASGTVSGSLATIRFKPEDGSTFDGKLSFIKR